MKLSIGSDLNGVTVVWVHRCGGPVAANRWVE